jgi:hypothetical protein
MKTYLLSGVLTALVMPQLAFADPWKDESGHGWKLRLGRVQIHVELPPRVRGPGPWNGGYYYIPPPPPAWGYQRYYGPDYGWPPGYVPPPYHSRRWFKDRDDYEDWLEERQERLEEWRERQREAYEDWLEDYEDRLEDLRERQRERFKRWRRGHDD